MDFDKCNAGGVTEQQAVDCDYKDGEVCCTDPKPSTNPTCTERGGTCRDDLESGAQCPGQQITDPTSDCDGATQFCCGASPTCQDVEGTCTSQQECTAANTNDMASASCDQRGGAVCCLSPDPTTEQCGAQDGLCRRDGCPSGRHSTSDGNDCGGLSQVGRSIPFSNEIFVCGG